jgi:hypothetical protein
MNLYYLASPYAHELPAMMEERYRLALNAVGALLGAGMLVFSPIAHNHEINLIGGFVCRSQEERREFWKRFDLEMLDRCDGLIVLALNGWQHSRDVAAQIAHSRRSGKQMFFFPVHEAGSFVDTARTMAGILNQPKVET